MVIRMTTLDTSVPFVKVLMVMPRRHIQKVMGLKDGYTYKEFDPSFKDAWCQLMVEVHLFDHEQEASKKWNQMLERDYEFFKSHFLFVFDENDILVGSAGLWYGNDFEESRLRLHYVGVSIKAQHQGIATSMITKLCKMYDNIPNKYPLYLSTQSQSYGAIALYSHIGFTPYLGEYKGCSEAKSKKSWEIVTNIMRERC